MANDNNLGNVVISGAKAAVDRAIEKAEELGAEAKYMNPQQLAQYQKAELARWAKVIKSADIHAE